MVLQSIESLEDIYIIDTRFLGFSHYNATYLIDADRLTLVDPGASPGRERLFEGLDELGATPEDLDLILLTHIHLDHAGAAGYVTERCPRARVVCHEYGIDYLSDPEKVQRLMKSVHRAVGELAEGYGQLTPIPRERFSPVSGGEELDLGDRVLEVIHAPGHAPHQVCYVDRSNEMLYPGDEAGMWLQDRLMVTTPPPNFDFEAQIRSLEALRSRSPRGLLYPHFGLRRDGREALAEYDRLLTRWVREVAELRERSDSREQVMNHFLQQDHLFYELWDRPTAEETIKTNVAGVLHYLESESDS